MGSHSELGMFSLGRSCWLRENNKFLILRRVVKIPICFHLTKNKLIYMLILTYVQGSIPWNEKHMCHRVTTILCFINGVLLRTKNWKLSTVWIITILKKRTETEPRQGALKLCLILLFTHHVIALINYLISAAFIWHYVFMEWYPVAVHSALAEYVSFPLDMSCCHGR